MSDPLCEDRHYQRAGEVLLAVSMRIRSLVANASWRPRGDSRPAGSSTRRGAVGQVQMLRRFARRFGVILRIILCAQQSLTPRSASGTALWPTRSPGRATARAPAHADRRCSASVSISFSVAHRSPSAPHLRTNASFARSARSRSSPRTPVRHRTHRATRHHAPQPLLVKRKATLILMW